jgi:hypothetical protein
MGGKSGSASTTYDYYGTIACGVCVGPVQELVGIILDGNEVWPEGKAWPSGGAAFGVNDGDMYVFDAQTWVAQQSFLVPANPSATDPTIPGNNPAFWVEYVFAQTAELFDDFTITTSDGTPYGTLRFYWGVAGQLVDPVLDGNNDSSDVHPNYAGICYCIPGPGTTPNGNSGGFLLGQQVQNAPNIEIVARRSPQQTVVTAPNNGIVDGQCNLAAFIAEVLTSENGIGLPAAALDSISFNVVAAYLQNNEALYGASPLIDTSDTLRSVLDQFTQMIDGFVRFNPSTGLIEMGVYQHGVAPAAYTTLTEDSLTERPQLKSTSWQGTYSRATVRYNDRQINFQQTSLHADDPRAWAVLKSVREISLDRPWITRASQALLHGRETLRVVGHAQLTGTLSVRREIGRNIRAGDYVLLDVDIEPNQYTIEQFFRVTKRTIPMTGPIKLEVLADNTLAAIPWNGQAAPVTPQNNTVPPVVNARFVEVPTVLSDERGAVAALVQRPSNLIVGCQLFFDTNPAGTFALLGSFGGFAAKGVLNTAVAAGDAVLNVSVDTTQPDADFFTQQFSANEQAADTMLAIVVSVVPSDPLVGAGGEQIQGAGGENISDAGTSPDAGEIAEDATGLCEVEICSVGVATLVSAGQYQLGVLRGRQNTVARAFAAANSEVWLIPRANLSVFTNALFATLRSNRAAGLTPAYAQFRLCPYTFTLQLPLSNAANEQFRFALNSISVPSLALSKPNTFTLAAVASAYPYNIPISGKWTDPNGGLVEIKVLLRKSTDTADRVIIDQTFAPTGSMAFSTQAPIDSPGTWTIKLIARDATNLFTEQDIAVTITGNASPVCAFPILFDSAGIQIVNPAGFDTPTNVPGKWVIAPQSPVAYGPVSLICSTPGATIYFQTSGPILQNGLFVFNNAQMTYVPGQCQPYNGLSDMSGGGIASEIINLTVWSVAPGFTGSQQVLVMLSPIITTSYFS